jgi:hypothetical protein
MLPIRRLANRTVLVSLLFCAGCAAATPTAQKSATAALVQLTAYETEVGQKIKAENDYYEGVMGAANQRVVELWDNEQAFKFEQDAKQFVDANPTPTAQQIGPKLVPFMDSSLKAWASRDATYESLLVETQETLRNTRNQLELERGKIRTLRGQLQNLGQRNDKEMLLLTIAFAKQVKTKLDELKDAAAAASATPKTDNGQ